MKIRFVTATIVAFLYAAPVLGVAIAHPRAQEEDITIDNPNSGETIEVQTDQPATDQQQVDQSSPDQSSADQKVDQASVDRTQASPGDPLPGLVTIGVNLMEDGSSAVAEMSSSANSTVTEIANAELLAGAENADQIANTLALQAQQIAEDAHQYDMEVTFEGERGKLVAHMDDLPRNERGQLLGGTECQSNTMQWVDNEKRDQVSLSLGNSFVLGEHVLLYRDPECKDRIDQGEAWPTPDVVFNPGDRVTFYFQWLELTQDMLMGRTPLPDGRMLPAIE
ncbi:hypothetical protein ABW20_dc0102382 [Dactylellina cionopaga]|nr:hypothetical protein ABW20_dc0102382 [Dactylellina cionopaga]